MAIEYKFEFDGEILFVTACGKDESMDDVLNYSKAILEKVKLLHCTKLFCDERNLEYALSITDTYMLAEKASAMVRGLGRIAIVCRQQDIGDGKFYETVATNRGMKVLVSSDYHDALNWLKS